MATNALKPYNLEEIAEIHDKKRIPLSQMERSKRQGNIPYCGANGIIDYIDDYIFDGEYILIAEDGGYWKKFEKTAYFMEGKFWVNNHAHIIKAIKNKTTNKFLLYWFIFHDIEKFTSGSTRKKLTQSLLRKIKITLPPLSEQLIIALILSTIQEAMEKTQEVIQATQELKKSLMNHLFTYGPVPITEREQIQLKETEIGEIPEEWQISKISDLAYINRESKNPAAETPDEFFTYIDISSVEGETGRIIDASSILGKKAPSRARRVIHTFDVLMSTVRPYLKAFTIVSKKYDNQICSTGYAVLTTKNKAIPGYLYYFLFTAAAQTQFKQLMRGSNYPAINAGHVKETKLPSPHLSEQQLISDYLSTIDRKLLKEENTKKVLEILFKSLLDNLMTGKIRVKDLNFTKLNFMEMEL